MALFSFVKKVQHKKFEYIPRYYDEAKEDLENRLKKYDGDNVLDDTELAKARIRQGMRRRQPVHSNYRKEAMRKSNRILLLTLAALLLLTMFFLMNYLPRIIAYLE